MYICITNVDVQTGVVCTESSMSNGPSLPFLKGFIFKWANESAWPILCNADGSYVAAPRHYGICDDDADVSVAGVLEVMTQSDWEYAKSIEIEARRPFASWVWSESDQMWMPPVLIPSDAVIKGGNVRYKWDEATVNWIRL